MSLLLGEGGTWMEPTRSFQIQTNVQTVQTFKTNETPEVHAHTTSGLQP